MERWTTLAVGPNRDRFAKPAHAGANGPAAPPKQRHLVHLRVCYRSNAQISTVVMSLSTARCASGTTTLANCERPASARRSRIAQAWKTSAAPPWAAANICSAIQPSHFAKSTGSIAHSKACTVSVALVKQPDFSIHVAPGKTTVAASVNAE